MVSRHIRMASKIFLAKPSQPVLAFVDTNQILTGI
jgi:hypothetical protein